MNARRSITATAIVAVALVPWALFWSSLPSQVATHSDLHGHPNGHLSPLDAVLILGGLATLMALAVLVTRVMTGPVFAFVGGVLAVASCATAIENHDVSSWQHARLSWLWIVASLVTGAVAAVVVSSTTELGGLPHGARPSFDVAPSERLAWVGHGRTRYNLSGAIAMALVGVVLLFVSSPPAGEIALLVAVLLGELSVVRVVVGANGVRVSAPLGFPAVRFRLDEIDGAEAIDVHPMEWGGWGYRGSVRLFKRAAWVLRAGTGMRLDLRGGRVFLVTVDDADEAVAVLNGLLATSTRR